jgi:hypothetical protein
MFRSLPRIVLLLIFFLTTAFFVANLSVNYDNEDRSEHRDAVLRSTELGKRASLVQLVPRGYNNKSILEEPREASRVEYLSRSKETPLQSYTLVVFVIPTTGRQSLSRAISSLQKQTIHGWRAIVVTHGVPYSSLPQILRADRRISVLALPAFTGPFAASALRNAALPTLLQWQLEGGSGLSVWAAFLDDDDVVVPEYVEWLASEDTGTSNLVDAVVFRMALERRTRHIVLPPPGTLRLCLGWVGISFALRVPVFNVTRFLGVPYEDFNVLSRLFWSRRRVLLSDKIAYRVRAEPLPKPLPVGLMRVVVVRNNETMALTCPK